MTDKAMREVFSAELYKQIKENPSEAIIGYKVGFEAGYQAALSTVNPGLIAAMEAEKIVISGVELVPHQKGINCGIDRCIALARTHGVEKVSLEKCADAIRIETNYDIYHCRTIAAVALDSIGVPYAE